MPKSAFAYPGEGFFDMLHASLPPTFELLPATPMVKHLMLQLRSKEIADPKRFAAGVAILTAFLFNEATRGAPTVHEEVRSRTGEIAEGELLATKYRLVAIERAAFGMLNPMRDAFGSDFLYGSIDIKRDHTTLLPDTRHINLPDRMDGEKDILLDPMLATGGSACAAIEFLKLRGVKEEDIIFLYLLDAPQGAWRVYEDYPGVRALGVAHDRCLNELGYILPGLGDAGDEIFGKGVVVERVPACGLT